jgi:hypothetical protein
MSIENFDNGSTKAAGFIVIGANTPASSAVGLGLVGMVRNGTGDVNLAWTEPIAEAEFHATATLIDTEGVIQASWLTPTSCNFQIADVAGAGANGSFCFVIRRIQGGAGVPVESAPS